LVRNLARAAIDKLAVTKLTEELAAEKLARAADKLAAEKLAEGLAAEKLARAADKQAFDCELHERIDLAVRARLRSCKCGINVP
jgi:hypothetical protein